MLNTYSNYTLFLVLSHNLSKYPVWDMTSSLFYFKLKYFKNIYK